MVMEPVPEAHAPETITEYVVETVGVATGFGQVVQLNPVDGVQLKLEPLLTFRTEESPAQITESDAVMTGVEPLVVK